MRLGEINISMTEKNVSEAWERKFRKLSHEFKLMNFRIEIHEAILLRTLVVLNFDTDQSLPDLEKSVQDARDQVLQEIEGIGAAAEKRFLSSESALDDSEKALYADEIRAIVDHMKTYIIPRSEKGN